MYFLKVPKVMVSWLAVFGKGGELKNWMLKQPVNNKGFSSIQFLILLNFFRARKFHFLKCKNFLSGRTFSSLGLKMALLAAYITTHLKCREFVHAFIISRTSFAVDKLMYLFRYEMMLRCWQEDPLQRPTFTELREELESIISEGGAYFSLDINGASNYYLTPSFNSLSNEYKGDTDILDEIMKKPIVVKAVTKFRKPCINRNQEETEL